MTATEVLRRLLDERGVEYDTDDEDGCEFTEWVANGLEWEADSRGELVSLMPVMLITPEQAIAATLGVEPDEAAMVKLHDRMNVALLECERALGIEKADGTIVVPFVFEMHNLLEEAATLGPCNCTNDCTNGERTETCHITVHDNLAETEGMGDVWLECDACDWQMPLEPSTPRFNFCPNCGARVVEPTTNDVGAEVDA